MHDAGPRRGSWVIVVTAAVAVVAQVVAVVVLLSSDSAEPSDRAPALTPAPTRGEAPAPERPAPPPPAPADVTPPVQPSPSASPSPSPSPSASPSREDLSGLSAAELCARAAATLRRRADGWLAHGQDLRPARERVELALARDAESGEALGLRAELDAAVDGPGAGLPWVRRAVRGAPDAPWLHLLHARLLIELGQDQAAEEARETAWELAELAPDPARVRGWVWAYRARDHLTAGRFGEGQEALVQARQACPTGLALIELLQGYLHSQGPPELRSHPQARDCFTRALRVDSRLADAWFYRGVAHFDLGVFEQAAADLDRAAELAEQVPHRFSVAHLRLVRGLAFEQLQRWELAYDDLVAYLAEAGLGDTVIERVRPVLTRLAARLGRPDPFESAPIPAQGH